MKQEHIKKAKSRILLIQIFYLKKIEDKYNVNKME